LPPCLRSGSVPDQMERDFTNKLQEMNIDFTSSGLSSGSYVE